MCVCVHLGILFVVLREIELKLACVFFSPLFPYILACIFIFDLQRPDGKYPEFGSHNLCIYFIGIHSSINHDGNALFIYTSSLIDSKKRKKKLVQWKIVYSPKGRTINSRKIRQETLVNWCQFYYSNLFIFYMCVHACVPTRVYNTVLHHS